MLDGAVSRVESLADHPGIDLPEEGALSYRENALAKARAVWRALRVPALGDDSGLEVDALRGEPGVRSARYAGPDAGDAANNERLLRELNMVPTERRTARFRCVLALVRGDGAEGERVIEGVCEGSILNTPRGSLGFGYDPLFLPSGESRTFAETPREAKNRTSHRGRAVAALRRLLEGEKE
jgi:XTP/dITP diphosphohydrolase